MAWMGFCRNGDVSLVHVLDPEAAKRSVVRHRDDRRYLMEVRIVDDKSMMAWRLDPDGNWKGQNAHRMWDDPVVAAALTRSNVLPERVTGEANVVVEATTVGKLENHGQEQPSGPDQRGTADRRYTSKPADVWRDGGVRQRRGYVGGRERRRY